MTEPKTAPQGNSSRTLVIVAVAVLIVVAIAGIVLAGRKAPADGDSAVAAAPAASADSGSTLNAGASPTESLPKDVVFAAGSDKLPAGANEGLARFAEAARGNAASSARLSGRFVTGANKDKDRELAKNRAMAIRHALEANGVSAGKIQVELIELPEGFLAPGASERIDLSLR